MKLLRPFLSGVLLMTGACRPSLTHAPSLTGRSAEPLSFIQARGQQFCDASGRPVNLHGCNLGNWFLLEMWMLGIRNLKDQHAFETVLADRFGQDEKDRLMELYRSCWFTDRDFDLIRSFGFNTVRLPFNYTLIDAGSSGGTLNESGVGWLDRALELAERHQLWVILDLHGAPGGQSLEHTTGRAGQNLLWERKDYQERTAWLWALLARRYAGRSVIAAYDLLNEPYGAPDGEAIVDLCDRVYRAIRAEDSRHVILFPGHLRHRGGISFYPSSATRGWYNVGFTEHFYPGVFDKRGQSMKTHERFISTVLVKTREQLRRLNAPFLVGEYQANFRKVPGPELMRRYSDIYSEYGWAHTLWSAKGIKRKGGPNDEGWFLFHNRAPLPPPDIRTASLEDIEAWIESLRTMNYSVAEQLRQSLRGPATRAGLPGACIFQLTGLKGNTVRDISPR